MLRGMDPTAFRPLGHSGLIVSLGASRREHLQDNLASLSLRLSEQHLRALDTVSALPPASPYPLFEPAVTRSLFGGMTMRGGV